MKKQFVNILTTLALLSAFAGAQQPADPSPVNPANVMVWGGACFGQDGTGTFSIYRKQTDTVPVWQETQPLTGSAMAFVGNASGGLPTSIFSSGDAGWLELVCNGDTVNVQPRRALTAAPYAMSAADSASLGGRPASDYALASQVNSAGVNGAVTSEASRAQMAETDLAQQVVTETTGRQTAIASLQMAEVINDSQVNAAILALQAQVVALVASNSDIAAQLADLKNSTSTSGQIAIARNSTAVRLAPVTTQVINVDPPARPSRTSRTISPAVR